MRVSSFILVIDSYLVRKGMASILNHIHRVRVVKEFDTPEPLVNYIQNQGADFIVISQSLFQQATSLFISRPDLLEKTILLTGDPVRMETDNQPSSLAAEAQVSIRLSEKKDEIISKILNILDLSVSGTGSAYEETLSLREKTIVRLISMGLTNRQIADELFLSAHTVITHRKNISSKLGIKSISGLTVYAIVNNIITIEEVTSKPSE